MIWQNPLAWVGLLALAVPVLVHLLSRRKARTEKFPTLRFLEASPLTPIRRARLSDLLLLAVRLGIIAMAVAALAQPLWMTVGRTAELDRTLARAIIVDTSASMLRMNGPAERALGAARRDAQRLASEASTSVIVETATPAGAIAGAVAWLGTQAGKRELVLVSDFQDGAVTGADLAAVPSEVGVHLARVAVARDTAPIAVVTLTGAGRITARASLAAERTDAEWSFDRSEASRASGVVLLAGAGERARADAAHRAARSLGLPADTGGRAVAIVYPGFEQRAALVRAATALDQSWMGDAINRIHSDSTLAAAALSADLADSAPDVAPMSVVVRTAAGRPAVVAARGSVQGRDGLLLFSLADPGSLTSAALIAAAARSVSAIAPVTEQDPTLVSADTIAAWSRPASGAATRRAADGTGQSDARWLWVAVLGLLAIETALRRTRAEGRSSKSEGRSAVVDGGRAA